MLEEKYWSELLQVLTGDDNFKIRQTEIEALKRSDTLEFYQHLNFYEHSMSEKIKRLNNKKNG